jgi:hypothetical protein
MERKGKKDRLVYTGKQQRGFSQLVRFLVVKLTHSDLNLTFDMCIVFITNYFSVGGDVSIDSETLLVINFVNLKIKPDQSFGYVHEGVWIRFLAALR